MKVIGIDIGGTSIKGMVVDRTGRLFDQGKIETDAREGKDRILANLLSLLDRLLAQHADIQGIGIGTAGRVNVRTGEVVYATDNLPGWQGTNLKAYLEDARSLPVFVDNDVNAALAKRGLARSGKRFGRRVHADARNRRRRSQHGRRLSCIGGRAGTEASLGTLF